MKRYKGRVPNMIALNDDVIITYLVRPSNEDSNDMNRIHVQHQVVLDMSFTTNVCMTYYLFEACKLGPH